jgi:TetR/AcrR family transcriptional regulator, mexJK operon transcriptional repressor
MQVTVRMPRSAVQPLRTVKKTKKKRSKGGRPSLARAASIDNHVLDTVWTQFVESGFGSVTIDAIAARGNLSKRTIYSRFDSKEELFCASAERQISAWLAQLTVPVPEADFVCWARVFAERLLSLMITPEGRALTEFIDGEGRRIPRIRAFHKTARADAIMMVSSVLRGEIVRGHVDVGDEAFAARCWLDILVAQARDFDELAAGPATEHLIRERAQALTDIFLRVVRYRQHLGTGNSGS